MALLCGCGKATKQLTTVELAEQESTETELRLDGQWYGYWIMNDSTDDWAYLDGSWWDCCAEVTTSGNELVLLIWDEDMPKDNYLAKFLLKKSGDSYSCTGGDFLDIAIADGQATINLSENSGALLTISGKYEDSSTGDFYYSFYMRPWGDAWPDSGRTPRYYQDWYLPMLQAGEGAPDEINTK